MCEALLCGMKENASDLHLEYLVYDPSQQRRQTLFDRFGVAGAEDNGVVLKQADFVFLAVKPQVYPSLREEITAGYRKGQVLISIMAGVELDTIGASLPQDAKIVRLMPNGAMSIGKGICLYCDNGNVPQKEKTFLLSLLGSMGLVRELPEKQMNAAMAVASCSPALYYTVLDSLMLGGIAVGLTKELSLELAAQSMLGSAAVLLENRQHPSVLRDQVLSPAGTTIEAVNVLEAAAVRSAFMEAVVSAYDRAEEMAEGGKK